jgi:predicted metal-binding membrane protein
MKGMAGMPDMADMVMPMGPWTVTDFVFAFAMWAVMMVGMMTPSAAPMILIYARVHRQAALQGKALAATSWFAAGYLLCWVLFSLGATLLQWAFDRMSWLTMSMSMASGIVGGIILIATGAYQWSRLKDSCLNQCRAPISLIQRYGGFKPGTAGSMVVGLRHGTYCIGCCWLLMALLFVGGVMNIFLIAAISLLVLAEKVLPGGDIIGRVAGVGFMLAGSWLIVKNL